MAATRSDVPYRTDWSFPGSWRKSFRRSERAMRLHWSGEAAGGALDKVERRDSKVGTPLASMMRRSSLSSFSQASWPLASLPHARRACVASRRPSTRWCLASRPERVESRLSQRTSENGWALGSALLWRPRASSPSTSPGQTAGCRRTRPRGHSCHAVACSWRIESGNGEYSTTCVTKKPPC